LLKNGEVRKFLSMKFVHIVNKVCCYNPPCSKSFSFPALYWACE